MTLWAVLSDVHGRGDRLGRVLADSQAQGAERVLALGDIASPGAMALLMQARATCAFGNWEASGLRGLPSPFRGWVARWPAVVHADEFLAAHASPVWPQGLEIGGVVEHLRSRGLHWSHLFPSLQHSEAHRLAAFAALESAGAGVFLHGHTHMQEAWRQLPDGTLERIPGEARELTLEPADRWLVGVGSVGDPHDGPGVCYALYDSTERRLTWRRT
jgi:predicted phosphodiesterase